MASSKEDAALSNILEGGGLSEDIGFSSTGLFIALLVALLSLKLCKAF